MRKILLAMFILLLIGGGDISFGQKSVVDYDMTNDTSNVANLRIDTLYVFAIFGRDSGAVDTMHVGAIVIESGTFYIDTLIVDTLTANLFYVNALDFDSALVHGGIIMRGDGLPTPLSTTYPFIEFADNMPNRSFIQSDAGHDLVLSNNYWRNPYNTTGAGIASPQRVDSLYTYGSVALLLNGGSQGYNIDRDSTEYKAVWWYNKDGATPLTMKALARWDFWKRGLIITSDYDSCVSDEHPTKALDIRGSIKARDTLFVGGNEELFVASADTTIDIWLPIIGATFDSLLATQIYQGSNWGADSVNVITHYYQSVSRDTVVNCMHIYHTDGNVGCYAASFTFPIPSDFNRFDSDSALSILFKRGGGNHYIGVISRKASNLGSVATVDSGTTGSGSGNKNWELGRAGTRDGANPQDLNSVSWIVGDKLIVDLLLYCENEDEYFYSDLRIRYKRDKF